MPFSGLIVEEENIKFFFKYDNYSKEKLLHIWVRHLTTIDNALDVFFENNSTKWNDINERFESYNDYTGSGWKRIKK